MRIECVFACSNHFIHFLVFPLSTEPIPHPTDAFGIFFSPKSTKCAFLSSDMVQINDNMNPSFSSIFSYKRDIKSLKEYGINHWFQWMNDEAFAFGTCPGLIIIFESIKIVQPIQFLVGSVISTTFVAYNYLGLCLYGPTITFISIEGKTVSTISIPSTSSFVKDAKVYKNNVLSVFVNGHPSIADLSKLGIEMKRPFSLRKLCAENVTCISINVRYSKIALAKSDGSVYTCNLYSNNNLSAQIIPSGGEVIKLFWICCETQLMILKNEGRVVFWNLQGNQVYNTCIPCLLYHKYSDFSDITRNLLVLDGQSLIKINFCSLHPPLCFTSSAIYSISKQAKIGNIMSSTELTQYITIPMDIYPITLAVQSFDSYIALTNLSKVVTIIKDKTYCINIQNVENMAWCKKNLAVFYTLGESHRFSLLTFDLKECFSFNSPQYANSISVSEYDKIVISSNNNTFTIFDFDPNGKLIKKPDNISFMMSSIEYESVSVIITTFSLPTIISNVICASNNIYIHNVTGDFIEFSTLNVIERDVHNTWGYRDLIFLQKSDNVKILDPLSTHEFKLNPLCSSGSEFVFIDPEFKYNFFPFSSADFVFITLQKLLIEPKKCHSFAYSLTKLPNFNQFMYKLCIYSTQNALFNKFTELLMYFEPKERASIVNTFDHHIQTILVENHFDFTNLFNSVSVSMKIRILIASNPNSFKELLNQEMDIIKSINKNILMDSLKDIITNGEWSKAMRLSQAVNIDFIQSLDCCDLNKFSLAKCFESISKDNLKWNDDEQPNILKFIGFSFIAASFLRFALSCFLVLHDEQKINFLFSLDPRLQDEMKEINNIDGYK